MSTPTDWIKFADKDLQLSKFFLQNNAPLAPIFHYFQQSAEKALKAYLLSKQVKVNTGNHNLEHLLTQCKKFDTNFEQLREDVQYINPYYYATQYPDTGYSVPGMDTAFICIQKAEKILTFVKNKINEI